tara:strand:+ start:122 stop:625 length:504 start_codon:yes stop_codon:yes gene_type:complete
MEPEFFIEIKDYPNYYISTYGRVFSEKTGDMKKLKPCKSSNGYYKVTLCKDGKTYNKTIHRLVAETFLERVEGKNEVDHIYHNKLDNRVEKLKWCDKRENNINKKTRINSKSGVNGVSFSKRDKLWSASIYIEANKKKQKWFKKKEDAINWRKEMEKKYYTYMDTIY